MASTHPCPSSDRSSPPGPPAPWTGGRARATARFVPFLALLAVLGCSYGFSSRTTGATGIDTIAIRPFGNRTRQPNIEIEIWDRVVNLFERDRLLKVVEEKEADSILEAVVVTYRNDPIAVNVDLEADEYRVTLVLEATFIDSETEEPLWKGNRFTGDGKYFLEGDEVTWEDALDEAASEIVQDLLNRIIGDW